MRRRSQWIRCWIGVWSLGWMAAGGCTKSGATSSWSGDGSGADSGEVTMGDGSVTGGSTASTTAQEPTSDGGELLLDVGAPPGAPNCDNAHLFAPTSLGCEFWAVDFAVQPARHIGGLGVSVGNPSDQVATITIADTRGPGGTLRVLQELSLDPLDSQMVPINVVDGSLLPGEDHTLQTGLNGAAAFRVTSDVPITATQINPVKNAESYVPDASLLLPTKALKETYLALGYQFDLVAIVATQDNTTVSTSAGDVELDAFDAWVYSTEHVTGFFVHADKPVAVFSGSHCPYVPADVPSCDHLEEQVVPLAAWGTKYVGARHPPRLAEYGGAPEPVFWRVVATSPDTTIALTPAVPGVGAEIYLPSGGEFFEFSTDISFLAESASDKPFMLVQYMQGGNSVCPDSPTPCAEGGVSLPNGDPSMLQMTPADQWVAEVPFISDTTYRRDFVVITRPAGAQVTLDCFGPIPDARFNPVNGTPFEIASIDLDHELLGGEGACHDGAQRIVADEPIGVFVGGVDYAASYLYPAGLNIDQLWDPPARPVG